jgi:hypothetical protein
LNALPASTPSLRKSSPPSKFRDGTPIFAKLK